MIFHIFLSAFLFLYSGNQSALSENEGTKQIAMDFQTTFQTKKSASEVYRAAINFRAWWSESIAGPTDQIGELFFYHYKDVHLCKIKLLEAVEGKKLVYEVVENEFNFTSDKREWVGTKLVFDISEEGEQTTLTFTHVGLVPEYECFEVCKDAWTSYIQGSLKQLVETGRGEPNPESGGLNQQLIEKWGLPNK